VEQALRTELSVPRKLRHMLVAAAIVGSVALTPEMSSAEGLLDFLFGGGQKQQHQTSFFGNLFNNNPQSPPPLAATFSRTRPAFQEHEAAKADLKKLVPEDAREAAGHGLRAKRSKSGAVSFELLDEEHVHAQL
jgi:hypothetical protein